MPVEIKELIIEGRITSDPELANSEMLTSKDEARIATEVMDKIHAQGGLTPGQRKELIEEMKREVRKMLEEQWRK